MGDETKQRIIDETLRIIGKDGVGALTVRKIAENTGVNVSAINYHFGNKEKLIMHVLKYFISEVEKDMEFLDDETLVPVDKLERFLLTYSDNMMQYPGLIRSVFLAMISEGKMVPELRVVIFGLMGKVIPVLSRVVEIKDKEKLMMIMMQTVVRVMYPVIAVDVIKDISGMNFADEKTRYTYIDLIMHSIESLKGRL